MSIPHLHREPLHATYADRGDAENTLDDDTGYVAEACLRLARHIVTLAALDYVAATYPSIAGSYIRNSWLFGMRERVRRDQLGLARCELAEFWNDGGGEFADWIGQGRDALKLYRTVTPLLPGESYEQAGRRIRQMKERARAAFKRYGGNRERK